MKLLLFLVTLAKNTVKHQQPIFMALSDYFKGKSGRFFWMNILAIAVVLIGLPLLGLQLLNQYTHHGEKISVPYVIGKSAYDAEAELKDKGLIAVIADSTYSKTAEPGSILDQTPASGSEVKSGRIIYLTVNLNGEPLVELPDLINNSSLREAEAKLRAMGFKLAPCQFVDGFPKDFVIGIKQGIRDLHTGDMISRDRAITIVAGAGESDSLEIEDSLYEDTIADIDF